MYGKEKTEHIPAIFEIGPPSMGTNCFPLEKKKEGLGLGVNPYLNLVSRFTFRF
jgi:hypothetical protein